jgi:hypothetical protein
VDQGGIAQGHVAVVVACAGNTAAAAQAAGVGHGAGVVLGAGAIIVPICSVWPLTTAMLGPLMRLMFGPVAAAVKGVQSRPAPTEHLRWDGECWLTAGQPAMGYAEDKSGIGEHSSPGGGTHAGGGWGDPPCGADAGPWRQHHRPHGTHRPTHHRLVAGLSMSRLRAEAGLLPAIRRLTQQRQAGSNTPASASVWLSSTSAGSGTP